MKKVLSIAAIIVLVIALAITSTVAIYSSTVDIGGDGSNTITAKKFYIGTKNGENTFVDAAIAPGETVDWDFTVTNQKDNNYIAAVDMDMLIKLEITTDITNLVVKLVAVDGINETVVSTLNKDLLTAEYRPGQPVFSAGVAKTYKYIVRIEWPANVNNAADTANGENEDSATIKVTVTGAQHV